MGHKRYWIGICISFWMLGGASWCAGEELQADNKFLVIADVHFDPYAGCNKKSHHCALLDNLKKFPFFPLDI